MSQMEQIFNFCSHFDPINPVILVLGMNLLVLAKLLNPVNHTNLVIIMKLGKCDCCTFLSIFMFI